MDDKQQVVKEEKKQQQKSHTMREWEYEILISMYVSVVLVDG